MSIEDALVGLSSSLNRVRSLANRLIADTGLALSDSAVRELHETQQCAAVVLLSGYFEAFLKDLVRRYIDELSNCGVAFADLPAAIQHGHFEGGGDVLTKTSLALRTGRVTPFGNPTPRDVVARLHSAASAAGTYQIVWEAFARTESNPGPEIVKKIAKSLAVENFWPQVSIRSGNPARWAETALVAQLSDLISQRNECAHTGVVAPIPTAAKIIEYVEMLDAIATGFTSLLVDELARHTP